MARERVPAFQFYPKDFLADGKQAAMSLAECGAYIRLLSVCWLEGSIPDDLVRVARIVGATPAQMRALWPAVRACFTEGEPGRLVHGRLERERVKQEAFRAKQAANGRRPKAKQKPDGSQTEANTQANGSFPISDLQVQPSPTLPQAGGRRRRRVPTAVLRGLPSVSPDDDAAVQEALAAAKAREARKPEVA